MCQDVLLLDFIHTLLGTYATKQTSQAYRIIYVQKSKTITSALTALKSEEIILRSS